VGAVGTDAGGNATLNLTWGRPTTDGNFLCIVLGEFRPGTTGTPSINWQLAVSNGIPINNLALLVYYWPNAPSMVTTGLWSYANAAVGASGAFEMVAAEFSGVRKSSPLDGTATSRALDGSGQMQSGKLPDSSILCELAVGAYIDQDVSPFSSPAVIQPIVNQSGQLLGTSMGTCMAAGVFVGGAGGVQGTIQPLNPGPGWGGAAASFIGGN